MKERILPTVVNNGFNDISDSERWGCWLWCRAICFRNSWSDSLAKEMDYGCLVLKNIKPSKIRQLNLKKTMGIQKLWIWIGHPADYNIPGCLAASISNAILSRFCQVRSLWGPYHKINKSYLYNLHQGKSLLSIGLGPQTELLLASSHINSIKYCNWNRVTY